MFLINQQFLVTFSYYFRLSTIVISSFSLNFDHCNVDTCKLQLHDLFVFFIFLKQKKKKEIPKRLLYKVRKVRVFAHLSNLFSFFSLSIEMLFFLEVMAKFSNVIPFQVTNERGSEPFLQKSGFKQFLQIAFFLIFFFKKNFQFKSNQAMLKQR